MNPAKLQTPDERNEIFAVREIELDDFTRQPSGEPLGKLAIVTQIGVSNLPETGLQHLAPANPNLTELNNPDISQAITTPAIEAGSPQDLRRLRRQLRGLVKPGRLGKEEDLLIREIVALDRNLTVKTNGLDPETADKFHQDCFEAVNAYFSTYIHFLIRQSNVPEQDSGILRNYLATELHRAFTVFDQDAVNQFSSYAQRCLVGATKKFFRDEYKARGLLTRGDRELYSAIAKHEKQGKAPAEVAQLLGHTVQDILATKQNYYLYGLIDLAIDREWNDSDALSIADTLEESRDFAYWMSAAEVSPEAAQVLGTIDFTPPELALLKLLYGIAASKNSTFLELNPPTFMNQTEAGEALNYSQQSISRLHKRLMDKLQIAFHNLPEITAILGW